MKKTNIMTLNLIALGLLYASNSVYAVDRIYSESKMTMGNEIPSFKSTAKDPNVLKAEKEMYDFLKKAKERGKYDVNIKTENEKNAWGEIAKYQNDNSMKMSGEEEKSGKTLMCLAGMALAPSECKGLLRDFFSIKKPHKRIQFLNKGPVRSGKGAEYSKQQSEMASKMFEEAAGGKNNIGDVYKKFDTMNIARAKSFTDEPNFDYSYHWQNKDRAYEGNGIYTCDVDPETGLNTKLEVLRIKHRHEPDEIFLRTLTKMPHNCINTLNHYPTTILPKYDSQKCDGKFYRENDFIRGYTLVNEKPIKIEKQCWYFDENVKARLEKAITEQQSKIANEGLRNGWSADKINVKLFNLTMPSKFKLPEPTK